MRATSLLLASMLLTAPLAVSAQVYAPAPGSASARVLAALGAVASNHRSGRYTHDTRIDLRAGRYEWDCSAMAAYVLRRSAPQTIRDIANHRPVAVDFYRAIRRSPATVNRGAWMRVARVADARPGDVFAWQRPRWFPSRNTGHVGFVVGMPQRVAQGVLLRIADATSVGHDDDGRDGVTRTGFGYGTLLITTDPATGGGTAYGWVGARTPEAWMVPTEVVIGRPLR
ncbi:MAG: hypothetical protein U0325_12590 [Polyangiales bacterium]